MSDPSIEVSLHELSVDAAMEDLVVEVQYAGARGPAGDSVSELFDSATPPLSPPFPYVRFERDVDGDVQSIVLGTVT